MDHIAIANRASVNLDDLEQLLRGRCTANVARRLGVTLADVDDFIRGSASASMTSRLGFLQISAADELAGVLDKSGRIGLLIGLLFTS